MHKPVCMQRAAGNRTCRLGATLRRLLPRIGWFAGLFHVAVPRQIDAGRCRAAV